MSEPVRRPGAVWLSAALLFLLLVIGGLWLRSRPAAPPEPASSAEPPAAPLAPAPPLQRGDLIDAALAAADAFAGGERETASNRDLVGRSFELRLTFGCEGSALPGSAAALRWTYDAASGSVEITAQPQAFKSAPWVAPLIAEADVDAVEGFWIERPWRRSAGCPVARGPVQMPASLTPQRQTLALVELFASDVPRSTKREGRPYQATARMSPEQVAALKGFALVVEGRLAALPNGEPIWCSSDSPDLRPTCLIAGRFERVRLENVATSEILGDWQR